MGRSLAKECALALGIVLSSKSKLTGGEIQLPRPTEPLQTVVHLDEGDPIRQSEGYDKLFASLDKFLTLSCVEDGIGSLLCSVFFDPAVPCNLVGAHWMGIRQALEVSENSPQRLGNAIAAQKPRLSILWQGIMWNGIEDVNEVFECVLNPLAITNLLIACWTRTTQSFLQATYHDKADQQNSIPRMREFSTAYFARDILKPFTRAPPFGSTRIPNTSLDVRRHLGHHHRPLQWRLYWLLNSGEKLLVDSGFDCKEIRLLEPEETEHEESR